MNLVCVANQSQIDERALVSVAQKMESWKIKSEEKRGLKQVISSRRTSGLAEYTARKAALLKWPQNGHKSRVSLEASQREKTSAKKPTWSPWQRRLTGFWSKLEAVQRYDEQTEGGRPMLFTRLICIHFSQHFYRTGDWDSPDAHLCKDLQMALWVLDVVIQVSWLKHRLLRLEQGPGTIWSNSNFYIFSQGGMLVLCIWDHTAQHSHSAACMWPLKWYKTDADSEMESLNKNNFSAKSRKGKNEIQSI